MWWGSGPEPGGSECSDPPNEKNSSKAQNQELTELKDQFEQQQVLIAQLKELLRKNDPTSSPSLEKVEEYAMTLSKMQSRAKVNKNKKTDESISKTKNTITRVATPGKEKIDLLRKQLEENKVKMAERGKNQKGIEEMVIQLKAQLDDSQALVNQSILNVTVEDNRSLASHKLYSLETPAQELFYILVERDKSIVEFKDKIKSLEGNVLDLQENIKEKDSVIEARTKAITLMSEDLSKKGKSTLDMLDETKEEMRIMQENFISLETKMKYENRCLMEALEKKTVNIIELEKATNDLEISKQKLETELSANEKLLFEKDEMISKITLLNSELQNKLTDFGEQNFVSTVKDSELGTIETNVIKNSSTKDIKKVSKKSQTDQKNEPERKIDIDTKENELLKTQIDVLEKTIKELQSKIKEKVPDMSRKNVTTKRSDDVEKLNKQLDEMNKNMIKVKAQNKAKIKELQKQIDMFKKVSNVNSEVIHLQSENVKLNQKIAELEEEKGNLQLNLVDYDNVKITNSELSIMISELNSSIEEQNQKLNDSVQQLSSLENTKINLQNSLEDAENIIKTLELRVSELVILQNTQVTSEITTLELEEQLDKMNNEKKELKHQLEQVTYENNTLNEKIKMLNADKAELDIKLDNLIHENIELIDRLEKLSTEKVSSAESIEIVESLTQQEKLEIEEYNKKFSESEIEGIGQNTDLNESIAKLTEESAELMEKIELFTVERKEVMDKMDTLNSENIDLVLKLEQIELQKSNITDTYETLYNEKCLVEKEMMNLKSENIELTEKIEKIMEEKLLLRDEHNTLMQKLESANRELAELTITKSNKECLNADMAHQDLRNKIQMYQTLVDEQKQQIEELQHQLLESNNFRLLYDDLLKSIETLKIEKDSIQVEKDMFANQNSLQDQEIKALQNDKRKIINEFELFKKKILNEEKTNYENLTEYQTKLQYCKKEIDELTGELMLSKNEIDRLNESILQLEELLHLEKENKVNCEKDELISSLTVEVNELKVLISENVLQLHNYEVDISKNNIAMQSLNDELNKLNSHIEKSEHLLSLKDVEKIHLQKELSEKEKELNDIKSKFDEKDKSFQSIVANLQEKYEKLQSKIDSNAECIIEIKTPLEEKISELSIQCNNLESKNKDQLDKMKKIAANLKKKATDFNELEKESTKLKLEITEKEEKITFLNNKLTENDLEIKTLHDQITSLNSQLCNLHENLHAQVKEFEKLSQICENQKCQIEELTNCNNDINNKLNVTVSRQEYDKLINNLSTTKSDYESILSKTNVEIENLNKNISIANTKLMEQEMIIDSLEQEKSMSIDKISRLEELISKLEDNDVMLNEQISLLNNELEEKTAQLELLNLNSNTLLEQLSILTNKGKCEKENLDEILSEKSELIEQNKNLNKHINMLQQKLIDNEQNTNDVFDEKIFSLESQNSKLLLTITHLENELKNANTELQKQIDQRKSDVESLENELSNQLQKLNEERRLILEERDYISDLNKEALEKETYYLEKINSLTEKMDEKEADFNTIQENNRKTISELYQVISDKHEQITKLSDENMQLQKCSIENSNAQSLIIVDQLQNALLESEIKYNKLSENYNQLELKINEKNVESPQQNLAIDVQNTKRTTLKDSAASEVSNIIWLAEEKVNTIETEKLKVQQREEENEQLKELFNYVSVDQVHKQISDNTLQENIIFNKDILESTKIEHSTASPLNINVNLNCIQDLEKKIKTLEFMLYDSDRSKEDALLLCQELSNEVARLVHEREKYIKFKKKSLNRELNITESNIITEFQPINMDSLESQILSDKLIRQNLANEPSIDISKSILPQHITQTDPIPIVEEPMTTKSAYVCFENNENEDIMIEDDNFWGSDEAKLEDEHIQSSIIQNNSKMIQLQERVNDLEMERERHLQEIKLLQVKSGKMIKKLKDLKSQNEALISNLNTKGQDSFGELDFAMQEEFKLQICKLEKTIKDMKIECEKSSNEREILKKRIDVLTAANERILDMKEKQDIEIEVWHTKYKEASKKLELLEWGDDIFDTNQKSQIQHSEDSTSFNKESENVEKQINELNTKINDLAMDNEELQALLEEQHQLRSVAEQKLNILKSNIDNNQLKEDYELLVTEKNKLNVTINKLTEEKALCELKYKNIIDEFETFKSNVSANDNISRMIEECNIIKSENINLTKKLEAALKENNMLNEIILQLQAKECAVPNEDKQVLQSICSVLKTAKNDLTEELSKLIHNKEESEKYCKKILNEYEILIENYEEKRKECERLIQFESELEEQNKKLKFELAENVNYINAKEIIILELTDKVSALNSELETVRKQIEMLTKEINIERIEFENKYSQNAEQWAQAVEQRGSDVAESWKLHLESRESEFSQIEINLKEELKVLEAKYNSLIASKSDNEIQQLELANEKETMVQTISKLQEKSTELSKDIENFNSLINAKDVQIQKLSEEYSQITVDLTTSENNLKVLQNKNLELIDEIKIENEKVSKNDAALKELYQIIDSKDTEIRSISNELMLLRETIAHHKLEFENMNTLISTKDSQIQQLSHELTQTSKNNSQLEQLLEEQETKIHLLKDELILKDKTLEDLKTMKEKIELSTEIEQRFNILQEYSQKIEFELKQEIATKETLINDLNCQLNEITVKHDEILYEKDKCIENIRIQTDNQHFEHDKIMENLNEISACNNILQDQIKNCNEVISNRNTELETIKSIFDEKNRECEELKYKILELNTIIDEDSKQLNDLKDLIETQVLKIEELKQLVDLKSNECNQLVSYFEANTPKVNEAFLEKIHRPQSEIVDDIHLIKVDNKSKEIVDKQPIQSSDDPAAFIRRAELDIALYMLHQRDVRCEELTVELMQLLEERDTLQLRLSNAIRINEELRKTSLVSSQQILENTQETGTALQVKPLKSTGAVRKSKSSQILLDASGTEIAKEATEVTAEDFTDLENKLSQLHSMDYRRDVRLRDDQETRHLQQMSILQQHKEVAAMLPPEAAARLVNASYTVSRDVQSPSTVLLNWLWGRSTPKVNHI